MALGGAHVPPTKLFRRVTEHRDLEICVRGHSGSFKLHHSKALVWFSIPLTQKLWPYL